MPFYEYQCDSCGHHLEAMQKVSDRPLKKCPHCGKAQLQKLMSAPVFRLKGGGWYETDFKSDQDNKRNLADRPEDAPKEEKKESKESKESKEAAPKETPAADAAKADKSVEKPAEKAAPAEVAKKSPERSSVGRSGQNKSTVRKRPPRSPVKRSAPKPARRR
jgi:putative FmdB family regulatory protein